MYVAKQCAQYSFQDELQKPMTETIACQKSSLGLRKDMTTQLIKPVLRLEEEKKLEERNDEVNDTLELVQKDGPLNE